MDMGIRVRGAKGHNLKGIDVDIPRNRLTVITGVSGSGKSTLAFDTLFAEGQRRYMESLSAYARQFLDQLQKPEVDRIDGLSPAIAIEQRMGSANPRSTVATTTEIHDFLRLLYANAGVPHCPSCDAVLQRYAAEAIVEALLEQAVGTRMLLLAPQPADSGKAGGAARLLASIRKRGYLRVRVSGQVLELDEAERKHATGAVEIVVDRLVARGDSLRSRLTDSVELALREGGGRMAVLLQAPGSTDWVLQSFSEDLCCEACGLQFSVLTPRHFSFNSPYGACPVCDGLGVEQVFDEGLLIPDEQVALDRGAIPAWRVGGHSLVLHYRRLLRGFMAHFDLPAGTAVGDLDARMRHILLHGSTDELMRFTGPRRSGGKRREAPFEGVIPNLQRRYRETASELVRQRLRRYMIRQMCPACKGGRLRPESAACRFQGLSLVELAARPISQTLAFLDGLTLGAQDEAVCGELLREIRARLQFLSEAGLGYLTLSRASSSLSGGEAQRLRLATQMGAALTGVLYVLDEPTIGLHERDNDRLIAILQRLRDSGNTVVVVEHDETMIRAADTVFDLGPGAGQAGGYVVFQGTPDELLQDAHCLTARFLRGEEPRSHPHQQLDTGDTWLEVKGACAHNLKDIDVAIPLGRLVCVSGVSGSGKSSLVHDVVAPAVAQGLSRGKRKEPTRAQVQWREVRGVQHLDKLIEIDQMPIGRTPRSNPITYTGAFDPIRKLFAATPAARVRGYGAGRFSFNVKGGRCEACQGAGQICLEMHFLPDVYVVCERCGGARYNRETLEVTYRGYSIADVLALTVEEALDVFGAVPAIARRLQALHDVGLGYVKTGQPAPTLSGGEAQRVKLAAELGRTATGKTLYLLDEPTTGLHFSDVRQLLDVLFRLRDAGNTILVIEHNLDVLAASDYVMDLGPEGGEAGGRMLGAGSPAEIAAQDSHTGQYLRRVLH